MTSSVLGLAGCSLLRNWSDESILRMFHANRGAYEEAVELLRTSGTIVGIDRVRPTVEDVEFAFSSSGAAFDRAQVEAYRDRFHRVFRASRPMTWIVRLRVEPLQVEFCLDCEGGLFKAGNKGVVYSEWPVAPIIESLDRRAYMTSVESDSAGKVYRRLEGNWYMFLQ